MSYVFEVIVLREERDLLQNCNGSYGDISGGDRDPSGSEGSIKRRSIDIDVFVRIDKRQSGQPFFRCTVALVVFYPLEYLLQNYAADNRFIVVLYQSFKFYGIERIRMLEKVYPGRGINEDHFVPFSFLQGLLPSVFSLSIPEFSRFLSAQQAF